MEQFEYIYDEHELMCNQQCYKTDSGENSERINYASLIFHYCEFSDWNLIKFNFPSHVKTIGNQSGKASSNIVMCGFKLYLFLTSSDAHMWMESHDIKCKAKKEN